MESTGLESNTKRQKLDNGDEPDEKLKVFLKWLEQEKVTVSPKVTITKESVCAQYGMVALEAIEQGACLFEIPRDAVLWQKNCNISHLIGKEKKALDSESGWVPLLITLLHEYLNPSSRWRAYLDVVPDYSELDHPMFWQRGEMIEELSGVGIVADIDMDLKKMKMEYEKMVLPFTRKYSQQFPDGSVNFELYKKLVAFVMGYSFTDPEEPLSDDPAAVESSNNPPMMVPLADILNHVAKNNAQLQFGKNSLKMCATKNIAQGEEIFNTYGELSNCELLHMYGFAELYPNNVYDTVEIPLSMLLTEYEKGLANSEDEKLLFKEKIKFLHNMDIVGDDGNFVINQDGVLTEDEVNHTLKVLHMDRSAFDDHIKKEGWSDDEEEGAEQDTLSNDALHKLPNSWKNILRRTVQRFLARYKTTLEEDEALLATQSSPSTPSTRRQRWALYVRHGQKKLLHNFIKFMATSDK